MSLVIDGRDANLGEKGRPFNVKHNFRSDTDISVSAKLNSRAPFVVQSLGLNDNFEVVIPDNEFDSLGMKQTHTLTIEATAGSQMAKRVYTFVKTVWLPEKEDLFSDVLAKGVEQVNNLVGEQKARISNKLTQCNIPHNTKGTLRELVTEVESKLVDPCPYPIYTVIIDLDDPNPSTRCTYADDAEGMIPMNYLSPSSDDWINKFPFNQIRPCVFDNANYTSGKLPKAYVKPNNYRQYLDSTTSISSTDDVMVEFPRFYHRVKKEGRKLYVSICEARATKEFDNFSHLKPDGSFASKIYIGAYLSYSSSSKAYSQYGKTLTQAILSTQKINALNRGARLINYHMVSMLQLLFVMAFKTTSTQKYALGNITSSTMLATGTTDTKGMYFTHDTGKQGQQQMKIFGIEDLWGNFEYYLDGLKSNGSGDTLKLMITHLPLDSSTYPPVVAENVPRVTGAGRVTDVLGINIAPFWPIAGQTEVANWTTGEYFADQAYTINSIDRPAIGSWCSRGYGPSNIYTSLFGINHSSSDTGIGARLAFVPNY